MPPPRRTACARTGCRPAARTGCRPETGDDRRLGALLVGIRRGDGSLRFLGRVGSGMTGALEAELRRLVMANPAARSPFADEVPREDALGAYWCDPSLAVEVRHLGHGVPPEGSRLRSPVLWGVGRMRTSTTTQERPMAEETVTVEVDGRTLALRRLDKVMYPATEDTPAVTKADVFDYARRVAPAWLAHLAAVGGIAVVAGRALAPQ